MEWISAHLHILYKILSPFRPRFRAKIPCQESAQNRSQFLYVKIPAHLHIPCQIPSRFRLESVPRFRAQNTPRIGTEKFLLIYIFRSKFRLVSAWNPPRILTLFDLLIFLAKSISGRNPCENSVPFLGGTFRTGRASTYHFIQIQ